MFRPIRKERLQLTCSPSHDNILSSSYCDCSRRTSFFLSVLSFLYCDLVALDYLVVMILRSANASSFSILGDEDNWDNDGNEKKQTDLWLEEDKVFYFCSYLVNRSKFKFCEWATYWPTGRPIRQLGFTDQQVDLLANFPGLYWPSEIMTSLAYTPRLVWVISHLCPIPFRLVFPFHKLWKKNEA